MKTKKHYKWLTTATFSKVKKLLEVGLNTTQIQTLTGISSGTVWVINRTNTLDEYLQYNRQRREKSSSTKTAVPTAKQYNTPVSDTPIYDVLVRIEQQLIELNQNFCKAGKAKGFRLF